MANTMSEVASLAFGLLHTPQALFKLTQAANYDLATRPEMRSSFLSAAFNPSRSCHCLYCFVEIVDQERLPVTLPCSQKTQQSKTFV